LLGLFVISIGLLKASLSTYWDFLNKPEAETTKTWIITGFFYGLSALPFCFYSHKWIGYIIRTILLTAFIPLWAKFRPNSLTLFGIDWDGAQIEENGRGTFLALTTPLLLI
jgi:hypothetical protein